MTTKHTIILLGTLASSMLARAAAAAPLTQSVSSNGEFALFCDGEEGSGTTPLSMYRVFDLSGYAPTVELRGLTFGVHVDSNAATGADFVVRIHQLDGPLGPGGFQLADLVTVDERTVHVPDTDLGLFSFTYAGGLDVDTSLPTVIEVESPDVEALGDLAGFAMNDDGETAPTYALPSCAPIFDPINVDGLPFPSDWPLTLQVFGFCGDAEVDAPEACDDGNAFALDGCEIDCTLSDHDGDGVASVDDNCPLVVNDAQDDADGDGRGDACDDLDDDDLDGDGIDNVDDNCPFDANAGAPQPDGDGDGIGDACDDFTNDDVDGDLDPNAADNCPFEPNADQADADGDGLGDACDASNGADADGDGDLDGADNCPFDPNANQADTDGDGLGNVCDPVTGDNQDLDGDGDENDFDNCPFTANDDQVDADGDGLGDACDTFDDADVDGDDVGNEDDNCPFAANDDQADGDDDGVGDACDGTDNAGETHVTVDGSGCADAGGGASGLGGLALIGIALLGARRRGRRALAAAGVVALAVVATGPVAAAPITQSNDRETVDSPVVCGTPGAATSVYRVFDLSGLGPSVEVRGIEVGVVSDPADPALTQPIGINLFHLATPPAGGFLVADLDPVSTETIDVPASTGSVVFADLVDVTIDTSELLVVEVAYAGTGGHVFAFGFNSAGQTETSYVRSAACGDPEPTDFEPYLGPDASFVLTLDVFGFCGDAELDLANEVCDDGNAFDGDGCDNTCEFSDFDGDGVPTAEDNCPFVANDEDPQQDEDGDGVGDACDDLNDDDVDSDGVDNVDDNCPWVSNSDKDDDQDDGDGDGIGDACDDFDDDDVDGDGADNVDDNCPWVSNNDKGDDQEDADDDGIGDACDGSDGLDVDGDGDLNADDNCPFEANANQADADGDGFGDVCDPTDGDNADIDGDGDDNVDDNCPFVANAEQDDGDGDGLGDACDGFDNDDADADGVENTADNCPFDANGDQDDEDEDGIGDACDGGGSSGETEVNVNGGCNDAGGGGSGLAGLALIGLALAFVRRRRGA